MLTVDPFFGSRRLTKLTIIRGRRLQADELCIDPLMFVAQHLYMTGNQARVGLPPVRIFEAHSIIR